MAKLTTEEFIAAIKELSVLELNDLVKACEEEFGVSAAAGVVVAAAGAAGEAAEEKDEFDVELTEGLKKGGYIHLYKQMQCAIWSFNICNIRLGCSGYCYYAISHHPELAIQYRGFTINADQSIETNFFSSASFLVSSFGKVT